jgi:hypothetical protein
MAWEDVKIVKEQATEKQIKYAEALLEALYGEIIENIYTMDKWRLSDLISELKEEAIIQGVDYHKFYEG